MQFHTWLTTGIPDGQPKMLLTFLPYEDFPLLNFGMATASKSCLPICGSGLVPYNMHLMCRLSMSVSGHLRCISRPSLCSPTHFIGFTQ